MLTAGKSADLLVRNFAKSNICLMIDALSSFVVLSIVSIPEVLSVILASDLYV